jgi:hypothetical protein
MSKLATALGVTANKEGEAFNRDLQVKLPALLLMISAWACKLARLSLHFCRSRSVFRCNASGRTRRLSVPSG